MADENSILIGAGRTPDDSPGAPEWMLLRYANRHGLITGATGTGKTVTLQVLAEAFSNAGVPVFAADIKGDLSGIAAMGEPNEGLERRSAAVGLGGYQGQEFPVVFWDLFGEKGHRIRATVSEMGPLLLARLLDLSDAQEGVINIAFKLADEEGLLLLDLKDLQALLNDMGTREKEISARYGFVSRASIGAIQRALLVLETQGGHEFFGEPALAIAELMRTTGDGRGAISVLSAERLMTNPRLYATFLLWLLSELFEELPERGDEEKPRLVFFFDEAHLLFDDAPKVLVERVEQLVRLIRSKGVGVFFVTQNPLDLPESVLAQLGNRVQHALRAYTPREQKAVRTAAETFRPNPDFDAAEAITQLGVGEALVSTLGEDAVPSVVQRTLIRPPASRIGPIKDAERTAVMAHSPIGDEYDEIVDRDSAYEMLARRASRDAEDDDESDGRRSDARSRWTLPDFGSENRGGPWGPRPGQERTRPRHDDDDEYEREKPRRRASVPRASNRQTVAEAAVKSVVRSAGSSLGRALVRGILGGLRRGF